MTQPALALPALVDVLAAELIALYARAEQDLLAALATVARHGFTDSTLTAQLVMLAQMRRAAQRIATQLQLNSGPLAARVVQEAAQHGDAAALSMLRQAVAGHSSLAALYLPRIAGASGHGIASANAIALDLASKLDSVQQRIVRFADDAYRAAVADTASRLVLGREGLTPATAQHRAWSELTRLGVTGYTDSTGRSWNLSSYVEMATRTTVQRAYNAAHQDRMTSLGIDYFTVPSDGHPCPLCQPWEGAILSTGAVGLVSTLAADSPRTVSFTVAATVEDARAAGLWHPNCRHVLVAYFPGVTRTAKRSRWTKADEANYRATQQQRSLERQVRAAKREQLGALDDLARVRAARRVRVGQARIRQHVAAHDLVRRSRREQLDLGNR